jgi:hypothetical protein
VVIKEVVVVDAMVVKAIHAAQLSYPFMAFKIPHFFNIITIFHSINLIQTIMVTFLSCSYDIPHRNKQVKNYESLQN